MADRHKGRKAPAQTAKPHAWRVIAPFLTAIRKFKEVDDEQFSFYLKKKPEVLIRDLSTFMSDSVDLPSLFHETADVLNKVTKAAWVSLYLVDRATNEVFYSKIPPSPERRKVRWKLDQFNTVATYVARCQKYVLVEDVLLDIRFPDGIGYNVELPKSVMAIPIVTPDGDCYAVMELVRQVKDPPFTENDLKICVMVTSWMGVAIYQNQQRLALKRQQELNDYLLDLIKCYFNDNVLMEKLMTEVIKFAKVTLGAERGAFFIIDQENDEIVAHLFDEDLDTQNKSKRMRFSKERGIAGLVARTGMAVNIKDAYTDSRFNKEIDERTGFITRSILCMPILGATGVLGVVQVVNKKNGACFTKADENLFKTFSLYCSLAVHYTNVHSQINKQKHMDAINLRTLKLQQVPCEHDLDYFSNHKQPKVHKAFDTFSWYVNSSDELLLVPKYAYFMITELIPSKEINMKNMISFILTVRKLYRNLPYHNFEHGFNVMHCMYIILKSARSRFTKIEIKALLLGCLCHDMDHTGYTNSFLELTHHHLAQLYDFSIQQNHHCHIAQKLLGEIEIFNSMEADAYKHLLDEVEKAILATDYCLYFNKRNALENLISSTSFSWRKRSHREVLKSVMVFCCDISGFGKPFLIAKRITDNLYRENYRQGDLEKEEGLCPLSDLDRDMSSRIPSDQIKFLSVVVIPCFDVLRKIFPKIEELYGNSVFLQETWKDILDQRGKKIWRQDDSICKELFNFK